MRQQLDILCIESDPAEQEAIREYGSILDWSVTFARNCTDGFNLSSARAFDLIFANQDLPDCDGFELAREIRESDGPNRQTPVVLNASKVSEDTRAQAKAAAINALIVRPLIFSTFKEGLLRAVGH